MTLLNTRNFGLFGCIGQNVHIITKTTIHSDSLAAGSFWDEVVTIISESCRSADYPLISIIIIIIFFILPIPRYQSAQNNHNPSRHRSFTTLPRRRHHNSPYFVRLLPHTANWFRFRASIRPVHWRRAGIVHHWASNVAATASDSCAQLRIVDRGVLSKKVAINSELLNRISSRSEARLANLMQFRK